MRQMGPVHASYPDGEVKLCQKSVSSCEEVRTQESELSQMLHTQFGWREGLSASMFCFPPSYCFTFHKPLIAPPSLIYYIYECNNFEIILGTCGQVLSSHD